MSNNKYMSNNSYNSFTTYHNYFKLIFVICYSLLIVCIFKKITKLSGESKTKLSGESKTKLSGESKNNKNKDISEVKTYLLNLTTTINDINKNLEGNIEKQIKEIKSNLQTIQTIQDTEKNNNRKQRDFNFKLEKKLEIKLEKLEKLEKLVLEKHKLRAEHMFLKTSIVGRIDHIKQRIAILTSKQIN